MKAHLRGKLLQLQLHKEDAAADPIGFTQKLEASCLSQVEKKTYDICKLRIFEVYPRIRYDVSRVRSRFSQAHVNGRVYRFPLRKVERKPSVRKRQRKPTQKPNKVPLTVVNDDDDEDLKIKSSNDDASPENSPGALDDESLAARRTKRENAGKRGGVQSKYIFNDERIVGQRMSSLTRRKPSATPLRPPSVNETTTETDDKSLVKAPASW